MTAQQVAVKKYIVKLSDEERERLNTLIRTGKHRGRSERRSVTALDRFLLLVWCQDWPYGADSSDREQSVHSIMNTDSGDHEHVFAPA